MDPVLDNETAGDVLIRIRAKLRRSKVCVLQKLADKWMDWES